MKIRWYVLGVLILTTVMVGMQVVSERPPGVLTVSFLNVGQGDATLITAPNGNQVLIDGGRDRSVLAALGRELSFFDREIEVIIATHPDSDHIGGLPDVLDRFEIDHVLVSGNESGEVVQDIFHERAEHVQIVRAGTVINLGDGAYVRILFPDRDVVDSNPNDASIIVQVMYGKTAFIATGDAGKSVEEYISFVYAETLRSDVLKVGHHGSKTSTSDMFVGLVNPDVGVVSAGCDNRYGHPHGETLDTLARFNVTVLTTCEEGTVTFVSDGKTVVRK